MNFSPLPSSVEERYYSTPARLLCRKCHFCERCDIVVHTSGSGHCCHWCWIKGKSYPSAKQLVNFSPVLCFHTSCIAWGHILVLYQSSLHQQSLIYFVTEHGERSHCTFHALHYTETQTGVSVCGWGWCREVYLTDRSIFFVSFSLSAAE